MFAKLWLLVDTSDFDALRMLNLLYAFGGHPALPPGLWMKLEEALLDFKYWFSDSTPVREAGGEPVVDNMWYWSENHVLVFRTCEYLAGQRFADRVFSVTGMTGRQHQARARQAILAWLEERARWGFTEWHSNVYYNWDMLPLLSLVEWAEDGELARRYALPWVLRTIAGHDQPGVDRERMSLPLEERPPAAWGDPVAPPPYGLSFEDEQELALWWSTNAFVSWPLLPMTFAVAERYDLWQGQFKPLAFIADLIDLDQPPEGIREDVYPLYKLFWQVINSPLLEQAHTYTFRTRDTMLSSVQDFRPGLRSNQSRPWQATLSERAMVFTQHPAYLPVPEGQPPPADWDWGERDEPGPGYWTGESSLPRIGQHENVAVIIYAPQYAPRPLGLEEYDWRPETHAYFPQAAFDEVLQDGSWTFGRKGSGFIGLYSYRATHWRQGQPEVYDNGGLDFDLVAEGGADNVWIVEMGSEAEGDNFASFCAARAAASVAVTPLADAVRLHSLRNRQRRAPAGAGLREKPARVQPTSPLAPASV